MIFFSGMAFAGSSLKAGDPAPDFELKGSDGKTHSLNDYEGKTVVLYFYPKNDTPGCTAEACNLRDNFSVLKENGVAVLGVSYDSLESHGEFIEKHELPFVLLSDADKKVSEAYDAKGMFMPKRKTFVIGEDGKIVHVFKKVDVKDHAGQILKVLEK